MKKSLSHTISRLVTLVLLGIFFSACVSDTLSTTDTQSQQLAEQQETPSYDPVQRQQAIEEIRAKSEQQGSGELTDPFAEANGPNEPLTPQEQASKIEEMQNTAQQNNEVMTDAELEAKQRSIREMQNKAKSHYGNAVNQIKN